jgi:hypothetical protein
MIVQIDVTEDHIKRGVPRDCCECPLVLAFGDKLSPWYFARVAAYVVQFWEGPASPITEFQMLPYSARHFRKSFDEGCPVVPFTFRLDIPAELLRENHETPAREGHIG